MSDIVYGMTQKKLPAIYVRAYLGAFLQRVSETTPNAVRRTYTTPQGETKTVFELHHNSITGLLSKIVKLENKYDKSDPNILIYIKQPSQEVCVTLKNSDTNFRILATRIKNIPFGSPVNISAFDVAQTDKDGNEKKDDAGKVKKQTLISIKVFDEGCDPSRPFEWNKIDVFFDTKLIPKWVYSEEFNKYSKKEANDFLWNCVEKNWNEKHDFSTLQQFFGDGAKEVVNTYSETDTIEEVEEEAGNSADSEEELPF